MAFYEFGAMQPNVHGLWHSKAIYTFERLQGSTCMEVQLQLSRFKADFFEVR